MGTLYSPFDHLVPICLIRELNSFQPCVNLAPLRFLLKVAFFRGEGGDILLHPLREVSKDFLPVVTENDEGSFTDRIALLAPAYVYNG